jgi:hypothetical protein
MRMSSISVNLARTTLLTSRRRAGMMCGLRAPQETAKGRLQGTPLDRGPHMGRAQVSFTSPDQSSKSSRGRVIPLVGRIFATLQEYL